MSTLAQAAIDAAEPSDVVAKAAAKDAAAGAGTAAEKEALGLALYREATGRFPQDSSDRRAVYIGGLILVGLIIVIVGSLALILTLEDKELPEAVVTLATALASGIIGGLFGYAKQ